MELPSIEQGRIIRLAGQLDMRNESELHEVLQAAAEHGGPILDDLSELIHASHSIASDSTGGARHESA